MNVIKVNINFKNRTIYKQGVDLTSGDYNSTKLVFEFDRQDGRKVFEMKDPDGNLVLWTEIENNEVVLVGKDENGNNATLFKEAGKYIFEVSLYDEDSKLTSAFDYIPIKEEQVKDGDKIVTAYLPIFDKLINEVENLNVEVVGNILTITKKDGTKESVNIKGDAYIITKEDMQEIETNIKNDIQPILEETNDKSDTAISISKGANQALSYDDYQAMITNFNAFESEKFNLGQQVMIRTLNVPDLWVYDYASENIEYEYVSDENFVNTLREVGYVQVGWYLLAELETQKVDLIDYVKNTDYATAGKGGVVKISNSLGMQITSTGIIAPLSATEKQIDERTNLYNHITPNNLNYAVGSVLPVLTQAEYDALEIKNENLYYFIVEE